MALGNVMHWLASSQWHTGPAQTIIAGMKQPIVLPPGETFRFEDFDPAYTGGVDKADAAKEMEANAEALGELTYKLFAERTRSLLLVLQGMDTSGKDGTLRHVMRGVSPQSCFVTSFRAPSEEELSHDFL
ncbi:MAG TPA: hypothetical protein VHV77_18630, partial [Pirellulales bacterium]|nr:hypothetical protein [Pirellulales bacterium]